jgi:threonine dehydrogenase-like Zn-dependent dehydrogenase
MTNVAQRPTPLADAEIPTTMRAVICHGPENYQLEEVAVPRPGPGEALVKVEAVGICASDLKCYHGAAKFWGDANRPAWAETEVIPGHEFVGTIVELDAAAAERWGVAVGDRAVSEQIVPCWKCRYCLRGQYWMCAPHDLYGFKRRTPGAMAEYMLYNRDALVHKVSADLPAAHAAFTEPLSCSLHAVERANLTFEDVVVVAGCGPIGLGMVAGARAKSPAHVIALDLAPEKLELAKECGADIVINIAEENAEGIIKGLTDGYGADVYLEGTGHPSAVPQGLNLLRKLGTYVEYGVFGSDVTVDWSIISDDKELNVYGAHLGPYCWPAAIRMIESGALPMEKICTHQLPLEEFQKGLELVASGRESVKVSLIP